MKKNFYILFVLLAIFFVSCGQNEEKKPKVKQEFFTVMPKKDFTLNPQTYKNPNSRAIITQLWEGICEMKPTGARLVSADSITHSKDYMNWEIVLRKDLVWSDGVKINAQTFKDSWEKAKNNKNINSDFYKLKVIKDVLAHDNVLKIKLNTPIKDFDSWLSCPVFFPVRDENLNANPKDLIVNGAFKVKEYNENKILLERNEKYWDSVNTRLRLVHLSLVKDKIMAYEMFQRMELDFIGAPFHRIPYERRKAFKTHPEAVIFPVNRYAYVEINKNDKFLNQKRVKELMYEVSDPEFMGQAIIQNNSPSIFPHPHPIMDTIENAKVEFKELLEKENIDLSEKLYVATYKASDTFEKRYLLSTLKEWISCFKLPIRVTRKKIKNSDFKIQEILIESNNIEDFYYFINYKYGTNIKTQEEFLNVLPVLPMNKIYDSILVHSNLEGLNIEPNGDLYLKYVVMRSLNEE